MKNTNYMKENREKWNQDSARRMREMRKRRAEEEAATNIAATPTDIHCFSSKQSAGKAIKRVEVVLPSNKERRAFVLMQLAKKEGLELLTPITEDRQPKRQKSALDALVEDFYRRDYISRCKPGRKDVVKVKIDGKVETTAKRFMLYTIAEAHALYLQEYPNQSVKRSKFYSLRPTTDVFLMAKKDQEVCVCPICENILFYAQAASLGCPKQLVDKLLCPPITLPPVVTYKDICKQATCTDCPINKGNYLTTYLPDKETFSLKRWVKGILVVDCVDKDKFKREFEDKLREYARHLYLKKVQSKTLEYDKETLKPGNVIIQTDFAENYAIHYQNEVMEAHWANVPGVVILTAVVYFKEAQDKNTRSKSFAVASDVSKNETLEMAFLLDAILIDLNNSGISFKNGIKLWTDGAAKHFKNRFAMCYLSRFSDLYGVEADWNFTESYHGKGPMDGVGAVVKHNVYMAVLRKGLLVRNPQEFYEAARDICKNITVLFRSAVDLEERQDQFLKLWTGAKECAGIQKARYVKVVCPYQVELYTTSIDTKPFAKRNLAPPHVVESTSHETPVVAKRRTVTNRSLFVDNDSEEEDDIPLCQLKRQNARLEHSEDQLRAIINDRRHQSAENKLQRSRKASHVEVGAFVLMKSEFLDTIKHYVGSVTALLDKDEVAVRYLRFQGKDMSFHFPKRDDIDNVPIASIVHVLPIPIASDGMYVFQGVKFPETMAVL